MQTAHPFSESTLCKGDLGGDSHSTWKDHLNVPRMRGPGTGVTPHGLPWSRKEGVACPATSSTLSAFDARL